MAGERERRLYPRNPLGIIALFVFFIEAISTVSLKFLLDAKSPYVGIILCFIIAFPSAIAILFFVTLWFRRESLYSPAISATIPVSSISFSGRSKLSK